MRDERHWLIQHLRGWGQRPALIWRDEAWSHDQLCDAAYDSANELLRHNIHPGSTLAICGDDSPGLFSLLVTAMLDRNVVVRLKRSP
jgi:hypothetical protein